MCGYIKDIEETSGTIASKFCADSAEGRVDPPSNLVTRLPKGDALVFISCNGDRISKAVMKIRRSTRKDGAILLGVSAHGDDEVEGCFVKHIQRLCSVCGNIDACFCHYRNCARMHFCRFIARTVAFVPITILRVHEPFGHLRSRCVVRAQEQYFSLTHFLAPSQTDICTVLRIALFLHYLVSVQKYTASHSKLCRTLLPQKGGS